MFSSSNASTSSNGYPMGDVDESLVGVGGVCLASRTRSQFPADALGEWRILLLNKMKVLFLSDQVMNG